MSDITSPLLTGLPRLDPVGSSGTQVSTDGPGISNTTASGSDAYYDRMSNAMVGADLAAQETGHKSFVDTASDLFSKGVPLIGAAVVNGFYNTAVEVGNFFGADAHKATIEDEFGPDSDTTRYYQQHAGPLEGIALAAGSLAPGLGATKLLKLAQTGKFGNAMKITTGLFSGMQDSAISAAAEDAVGNATGQSLFGLTAANKIKAVLAGGADQALQGAVYETASLATQHASPLLDNNSMSDNLSDIKDAMLGFGLTGGLIEGAQSIYKINKTVRALDMGTKEQEVFGALGKGNLTPGDRVINLYDKLDSIPSPSTGLGQMKNQITNNTTSRLIQEQLIKAAGGKEDVASAFRNFLENGRSNGLLDKNILIDQLGQLSQLGRHSDINVGTKSSDVFYLPDNIGSGLAPTASHEDIMSRGAFAPGHLDSIAPKNAWTQSQAYQLRNPNVLPTIARETDAGRIMPFTKGQPPTPYPVWDTLEKAWKSNADIFVAKNGQVTINPDTKVFHAVPRPGESRILSAAERAEYIKTGNLPAGSKPLNGVGLTLDITNGKLYGDAPLPVIGDIGKPGTDKNGIRAADAYFPQKMGAEFDPSSPLDANARYVWAALRGLKEGDAIHPTDLPSLEQAWREMSRTPTEFADKNITFTDDSRFPTTPDALLQHIADIKQSRYADLLAEGKNADEISHILNAPTKGMTKNFNTLDPTELITSPEQSANIRHIRLGYDIGTTKDSEGNLLRGLQATSYRMKLAADTNATTVANYLSKVSGPKADQYFSSLQFTKGSGDADILGAGATFLKNANADYGTLAEQSQRIGRTVAELSTQLHSKVADTLAGATNAIRNDPVAAAEYGNFVAVRHTTGEHYIFLSDADAAANNLPKNTAVLEGAVTKDEKTGLTKLNKQYIPPGFTDGSVSGPGIKTYYTLSNKVANLERASLALNSDRLNIRSDWWTSQGLSKDMPNPDRLYVPPINGDKYPFMAYVRQRAGYALGEGGASVITARNAGELQEKIANLGPEWDAFTKQDIANFKQSQGEYEFNRNFMTNRANTELARKGILNNVVPETRPQNLINDLVDWHFRQETQLLRDHVELHNAATFDQLKAMGDRWDTTGTSRFGAITPFMQRSATNPYSTYIRTALGVSPKDNYPLWQVAQDKLESFGNTAFDAVRSAFGAMQRGILPVEQAAKVSERFGLGNPYGTAIQQMSKNYYGGLANQLPSPDVLRKFVATANTTLGASIIRLDTFQQIIHAVTLPIMTALEYGSASRDLSNLTSVTVPGTTQQVPGLSKVLFNAVRNYFGDSDGALKDFYSQAGLTRDELTIHRQMIDSLTMPAGKLSELGWAQKMDNATQSAEKLSGSKFTNQFIHFVASDVGRQLGQAQGQVGQELLDTVGTFANRVLGNVSAGQRAAIFQGPVGQAVGLFQSYQWNLMQQLLRHIGEGDVKALAMGAGMQSSIFGLSSLPGFQALNSMIAHRHGNTEGQDIYSGATDLLGKEAADFLLYGAASGLTGISLYSRGDLNPRRATILPVNPLQFPTVRAGIGIYNTVAQLAQNLTTKSSSVPVSLMMALEHNGLSRPLSGLAQLLQGYTTQPNGNLVATNQGLSDLTNIATFGRLLGAKPLDEAVSMDALYRSNAMKLLDTARLQELGTAAKTALVGGQPVSPELTQSLLSDYTKAGGNAQNFSSWFLQQSKEANVTAVNRSFEHLHNPHAQYMQTMMGGQQTPDFRNTGSTQTADTSMNSPQ